MANEPDDEGDDFEFSFKEGEETAIEVVKDFIKQFMKEFPGKKHARERLYSFSGMSAGYLAAFLFHSYMEMIRLLKENGEKEDLAEYWCQKVVTTFGQAVTEAKIPVKLQFLIRREGRVR